MRFFAHFLFETTAPPVIILHIVPTLIHRLCTKTVPHFGEQIVQDVRQKD